MRGRLEVTLGQCSRAGRKAENQDFHGAFVPDEPLLGTKGIAVALADGISSSAVGHVASESAVKSFLLDYYCTSEAWSVKTSAHRVLTAVNSWLHAQTRRSPYQYERDRGYVCTFSALVLKSTSAHLFHVGDARIYRLRGKHFELLTDDHRIVMAGEQTYLARALGIDRHLELDYHLLPVKPGDLFVLATDGVHEAFDPPRFAELLMRDAPDLDQLAATIVDAAFEAGSADNLTLQLVRIDALPDPEAVEVHRHAAELPLPPMLQPRMDFDGFEILRTIHGSSRSHIHLARDKASGTLVALKTPSFDLRQDADYLERFLLEEWIARRVDSAHVLKPHARNQPQRYLYVAMEYLEGQSLTQWMTDHPRPTLTAVRDIVEQIARGLQAFHRREMLHRDLRPENVMIDASGTVKIIDFGSTLVAGVHDIGDGDDAVRIMGTHQYTAPECFLGEPATPLSDLFSLAVMTYQMLSGGTLPYGAEVARTSTRAAQRRLRYRPVVDEAREIPGWVDEALRKALDPSPLKRQQELSEFVTDLSRPAADYLRRRRQPLIDRHPQAFWQVLSLVLGVTVLVLLATR
ncbi:MAG: bifunctional protein-serine/threonine kinase/phosphatase [Rhodocyclaceae bacterium]|nr:bifunctional protein-serine/threonine kinase/phosphatase [Rhodocyclaceae bacterium]